MKYFNIIYSEPFMFVNYFKYLSGLFNFNVKIYFYIAYLLGMD